MSNTLIITNAGLALISQLLSSGDPLVITRVKAGTGADPGAPYTGRTALVTPLQDLAGLDWALSSDKITIIAYYENTGLLPVSITEVGVYAQSGAGEILYAIAPMYSAADWIPPEEQMPCRSTYTLQVEISTSITVQMYFANSGYLTQAQGDARYAAFSHTHTASALPNASTSAAGIAMLSNLLTGTSQTKAVTENAAKLLNDKCLALADANALKVAVRSSGNYFTVTDASITAYTEGRRFLFYFDNAADAPQVRINALAYYPLVSSAGVPMKVKAGQMVDVFTSVSGTSFSELAQEGGIDYPDTITAGDTPVANNLSTFSEFGSAYVSKKTYTPHKACTVRVKFNIRLMSYATSTGYGKLTKNGVDVSGSEATVNQATQDLSTLKVVDVALAANEVLALQIKNSNGNYTGTDIFAIHMAAPELQAKHNEVIT